MVVVLTCTTRTAAERHRTNHMLDHSLQLVCMRSSNVVASFVNSSTSQELIQREVPARVHVRVDDHTVLTTMLVEQLITAKPVLVNRCEEEEQL